MVMRLLSSSLIFVVIAGAQVQHDSKKRRSEAEIIFDGNQIYNLCQGYKTDGLAGKLGPGCHLYIAGVAQTLVLADDNALITAPCPGKGVTEEQITDVVIKYLDNHPENRQLPAPFLIGKALNEAFPCNP